MYIFFTGKMTKSLGSDGLFTEMFTLIMLLLIMQESIEPSTNPQATQAC